VDGWLVERDDEGCELSSFLLMHVGYTIHQYYSDYSDTVTHDGNKKAYTTSTQ
jgi:hypothetical protein